MNKPQPERPQKSGPPDGYPAEDEEAPAGKKFPGIGPGLIHLPAEHQENAGDQRGDEKKKLLLGAMSAVQHGGQYGRGEARLQKGEFDRGTHAPPVPGEKDK